MEAEQSPGIGDCAGQAGMGGAEGRVGAADGPGTAGMLAVRGVGEMGIMAPGFFRLEISNFLAQAGLLAAGFRLIST